MSSKLGPGPKFILQNYSYIFLPPFLFAVTYHFLQWQHDFRLRPALYIAGLLLSAPISLVLSFARGGIVEEMERRRMGAVWPKHVKSNVPGGFDTVSEMIRNFKTGYPGDQFRKWMRSNGNVFTMNILFEKRLFTCEPDHVKAILATDFNSFEKGWGTKHQLGSLLGTGVFNSDGDMWKFHRSMTRPFFSRDRISDFDIFGRHADEAIAVMKSRMKERSSIPIDFQDVVSRFTLDSATEFLFGSCVHSLEAGLPYPHNYTGPRTGSAIPHPSTAFASAFQRAQDVIAYRSRFGTLWPVCIKSEFWQDGTAQSMKIIDTYLEPILKKAVERKKEEKALKGLQGDEEKTTNGREAQEGETLLDHLVNYTEDPTILKDETLNILLAGRDTTACTLTFVIYLLSQHPDVLARLRSEILDKVGPTNKPSYEDVKDMKYLRAVINETLRLFPPVPFNSRFSSRSTTLSNPDKTDPRPLYVPAGIRCMYSVFLMHRRTDLWGPDALKFDPDRFLDERLGKYLTPNPFIFVPFNAGPRICLGQQFAYNEASFMLIRFLQAFEGIDLAPEALPEGTGVPEVWQDALEMEAANGMKGLSDERKAIEKTWPKSHLTMYANGGLWIRLNETKNT